MIEATLERLVGWVKDLTRRVERLEAVETTSARWVILPQASRLTSTAWDGDARSTTSPTQIDMSAVFGTPTNIDALLLLVEVRDLASAETYCWIRFDNAVPTMGTAALRCADVNDRWAGTQIVVPTDANGDIYFECAASGANTLNVILQVHGYHLR